MINSTNKVGRFLGRACLLLVVMAMGCNSDDERLVELAREADARQAEQNREIAKQNQDLAEATNKLIEADAESRKELVALERDVQAERVEVGRQRDQLEAERREIAEERQWDSTTGEAVRGGALLLACLLPMLLCGYMLHVLSRSEPDEAIGDILTAEILSDKPAFLSSSDSPTGEITDGRDQLRGPKAPVP